MINVLAKQNCIIWKLLKNPLSPLPSLSSLSLSLSLSHTYILRSTIHICLISVKPTCCIQVILTWRWLFFSKKKLLLYIWLKLADFTYKGNKTYLIIVWYLYYILGFFAHLVKLAFPCQNEYVYNQSINESVNEPISFSFFKFLL